MTIYETHSDTDTFYHLVTDEFHVLQQLRIQPWPCQCLLRNSDDGRWYWITQEQAARILSTWQRHASGGNAEAPKVA